MESTEAPFPPAELRPWPREWLWPLGLGVEAFSDGDDRDRTSFAAHRRPKAEGNSSALAQPRSRQETDRTSLKSPRPRSI